MTEPLSRHETSDDWWTKLDLSDNALCKWPVEVFATVTGLSAEEEKQREILHFVSNLQPGPEYGMRCGVQSPLQASWVDDAKLGADFLHARFDTSLQLCARNLPAELSSKLCDYVWSYKGKARVNVDIARKACTEYIEAATRQFKPPSRHSCLRLGRALYLATTLKDADLQGRVVETWSKALQEDVVDDGRFMLHTARLLEGRKTPLASALRRILGSFVAGLRGTESADIEEELCQLAARLAESNDDARTASVAAGRISLNRAKMYVAQDQQGLLGLQAATQALSSLKAAGAPEDLIREASALRVQAHGKINEDTFVTWTGPLIDVSPIAQAWQRQVAGKESAMEALRSFCSLSILPSQASLLQEFQALAKGPATLAAIGTALTWSPDGREVVEPNIHSTDPSERERAVDFQAHKKAKFLRSYSTATALQPCVALLKSEHASFKDAICEAVCSSPLVAESRRKLVLFGLYAGLDDDWVTALHYLIPQFEASLRALLPRATGAGLTPNQRGDEIQVVLLDRALSIAEKHQLLTEDELFNLRGLLAEEAGSNLRNRHCHGLLDESDYICADARFFWWLYLRLIVQSSAPSPSPEE